MHYCCDVNKTYYCPTNLETTFNIPKLHFGQNLPSLRKCQKFQLLGVAYNANFYLPGKVSTRTCVRSKPLLSDDHSAYTILTLPVIANLVIDHRQCWLARFSVLHLWRGSAEVMGLREVGKNKESFKTRICHFFFYSLLLWISKRRLFFYLSAKERKIAKSIRH